MKNTLNKSDVLSPTFNILNEYQINDLNIKHFDLYRIKNKKELSSLGLFEEEESVKIIEWPEILEPIKINKIEFHFSYSNDFKNRNLIISTNYKNQIIDEFK
jgi:Predicted ATPase or kinase